MHDEDKIKVFNMFFISDDKNNSLWSCLKLCNLPNETQLDGEIVVMEKLKLEMRGLTTENAVDIDKLVSSTVYRCINLHLLMVLLLYTEVGTHARTHTHPHHTCTQIHMIQKGLGLVGTTFRSSLSACCC